MFVMFIGMMMFLWLFSFFFVEESFEWFLMLDFFHGILIDYIHNLGLVRIFFGVFDDRHQCQNQSQKQEELDEIIWSAELDGLCTGSYDIDGISDP